jgi:hypothetical protein
MGITLLAIVLTGTAIGGAVASVLFTRYLNVGYSGPILLAVSVCYSACALASAFYLWRMQRSGLRYFYAWGALALVFTVLMMSTPERASWQMPLAVLGAAVAVLVLGAYVNRSLKDVGK